MADESETKTEGVSQKSEQELVKICKRRLENWREVLTHCHALLTWKKPYYPGIIAAIVTFVFLMLWYFDTSVLTTASIFGIIACILDYVVPILSASFFDSNKWTGTQERKYEEICHGIVDGYLKIKCMFDSLRQVKETRPYCYFVGVLGVLLFTAWIGNLINNLFLIYLNVLFIALLPGLKSHPMIQENISKAMSMIGGIAGQSKKNK
ncbi:ADP-ribosylation factor-like protein 6-interacting protein 1 [Trichonephila clavata]|uniref:ADP-ribosylation factor-like protein 6-interacting protein 1 n=1 Tax=Trichonephila clavata TaxID=2740835 RepID=A0A8X6JUV0_TRICU|nr:ADP-ribosylation factor-like protein 6-interacting protein 1 [Trichonephila clavata]